MIDFQYTDWYIVFMSKREEILKVALELFSNTGYENTGIQKIVDGATVTKPTLYHYFGSKKGLLIALLENNYRPFLRDLKSITNSSKDITLVLEDVTNHYFNFANSNPVFYRFFLSLMFAPMESEARLSAAIFLDEQFRLFEDMFKRNEEIHGNMIGRSRRYAVTFQGVVNSYITMSLYDNSSLDRESAHNACHQFMHGIFS